MRTTLATALLLALGRAAAAQVVHSDVPFESYPVDGLHGPVCLDGGAVGPGGLPYAEDYGGGPVGLGYPGIIGNGGGDPTYAYDQQDPWLHGYHQEMPAYGGYAHFRPYNYRHVLSQTQVAAGWGLSRTMPYSQQFWHRYHARAALEHCPLPAHAYDEYRHQPAGWSRPSDDTARLPYGRTR
jgi:hypothetical protein